MADVQKVLGQAIPALGVLTTLYTVPGATSAVVSTITICNQQNAATTVRLSVALGGAADEAKQYLYYELPLQAYDSFSLTQGLTVATTDVIRGYSGNGLVSFNIFGIEIT